MPQRLRSLAQNDTFGSCLQICYYNNDLDFLLTFPSFQIVMQASHQGQNDKNFSTFYSSTKNQQHLPQVQDLIWSSKKLIQENEQRRRNMGVRPSQNNIEGVSQAVPSLWSNKKLTTRQKIDGSMNIIQNNGTIAQEILGDDNKNKKQYLSIVSNLFAPNAKKKRRSSRRRQSSSSSEKESRKAKKERLNFHLEQVMRNVNVGSRHFLKEEDQRESDNDKKMRQNNKIKQNLQQQMESFDSQLKRNKKIKTAIEQVQGRSTKQNTLDSQRDRVSIKLGSKNSIKQNENIRDDALIQLSLTESEEQQENRTQKTEKANNFMAALLKQIDDDINKFKRSQKQLKTALTQNYESHSTHINNNQSAKTNKKRQKNDNQLQSPPSGERHLSQNQAKISGSGIYSFRQNNESADLFGFLIPKEQENKSRITDNNQNNESEANTRPYHPDHGSGLSQDRVHALLSTIANRIRYSPVIIEPIQYQHAREDNNQLQIDSRFRKQENDRKEVIKKVVNYVEEKNRFVNNGYKVNRFYDGFKLDQQGRRGFVFQKVWKSPDRLIKPQKFVSLKSPILNGQSCCNDKKYKNVDTNWRNLLLSRSADTLATVSMALPKRQRKTEEYSSASQPEEKSLESSDFVQQKCIMKQKRWDPIRRLRKQIEI